MNATTVRKKKNSIRRKKIAKKQEGEKQEAQSYENLPKRRVDDGGKSHL